MYSRIALLFIFLCVAIIVAKIGDLIAQPDDPLVIARNNETKLHQADDNVFVFIQITDLHISIFKDALRFEQLKEFCDVNIPTINPKVILATGDLTDAKMDGAVGSRQWEKEWFMYNEVLKLCRAKSSVQWLDMRGNHDNFNVRSYDSFENYYRIFRADPSRKSGSYMVTFKVTNDTSYGFVAIDAALESGPRRHYNFIGQLDRMEMAKLERFQQTLVDLQVNASIWFGHYPTSTILSPYPGIRQIASNSTAYLCGHFHSLYGLIPMMYTRHHTGLMELELADWKDKRRYRVGVFDQGLFSFSDVDFGIWPVIVVTNPKAAYLTQPSKEPLHLVTTSTHIRMLIYSPAPIEMCEARIDGEKWKSCQMTGKNYPMFTLPWQPNLYSKGLHQLEVRARDGRGSENQIIVEFSMDGTKPTLPVLSRFILMIDITTWAQLLFGLQIAMLIIPLCIIRVVHRRIVRHQMKMIQVTSPLLRRWLRRYWMMATMNFFFYPFAFYTLYLVFGPWFIGEVIDGTTGVVFVWGIIMHNGFLVGTMTYFYGFIHLLLFNWPLLFILGYTADLSAHYLYGRREKSTSIARRLCRHSGFIIYLCIQLIFAWAAFLDYGPLAVLLCPSRTWALVLAIYLWNRARKLKKNAFLEIATVWFW